MLQVALGTPLPPLASAALDTISRTVINHAELANNTVDIQMKIQQKRPANTNQGYKPKQAEIERFANGNNITTAPPSRSQRCSLFGGRGGKSTASTPEP